MDIKPDKVSNWKMKRTYDDVWNERKQILPEGNDQRRRFEITSQFNDKNDSIDKYILKGGMECSKLSTLFFSPENRQEIQTRIRYEIWLESHKRYIIDSQNDMELTIMMRSIFLQHSKNLNCLFKEQIVELNDLTVQAVIPGLLSHIKQYVVYLRDKSQPFRLLDRPKNTNTTGTKSLRLDRVLG